MNDMTKSGIMFALALCCAGRTFGWTEAETNAVVRELVKVAAQQRACDESIGSDCLAEPPTPEVTTYESLFAPERQVPAPDCWPQWTSQDRRNAFEDFVRAVASGSYLRYGASASDALWFCHDKGAAFALQPSREILQNVALPSSCRVAAARVFASLSPPTAERDAFAEQVLANGMANVGGCGTTGHAGGCCLGDNAVRDSLMSGMCEAVECDWNAGRTNEAIRCAAMLYRRFDNPRCALDVDRVLLCVFPDYASSSNRLAVAISGVDGGYVDDDGRNHFSVITNQLLEAQVPLQWVEALK